MKKKTKKTLKSIHKHHHSHHGPAGVFVPAGLLIGMGVGFVNGNIPAGLFIGLGIGLAIMAIIQLLGKK